LILAIDRQPAAFHPDACRVDVSLRADQADVDAPRRSRSSEISRAVLDYSKAWVDVPRTASELKGGLSE
jgi:hypothetical protein